MRPYIYAAMRSASHAGFDPYNAHKVQSARWTKAWRDHARRQAEKDAKGYDPYNHGSLRGAYPPFLFDLDKPVDRLGFVISVVLYLTIVVTLFKLILS